MPVIAYKDRRRAAIEQATAVVNEASAKATQVTTAQAMQKPGLNL